MFWAALIGFVAFFVTQAAFAHRLVRKIRGPKAGPWITGGCRDELGLAVFLPAGRQTGTGSCVHAA